MIHTCLSTKSELSHPAIVSIGLVWFRRDLRDHDHAALAAALANHTTVYCVFVFDCDILESLPRADRRVEFIWHTLKELDAALQNKGGGLIVRHGRALEVIPLLAARLNATTVYANRDYEPVAVVRDNAVSETLQRTTGVELRLHKDQVIFECDEVLTKNGTPFGVFTPYKNAWIRRLYAAGYSSHTVNPKAGQLVADPDACGLPTLEDLGFLQTNLMQLRLPTGMSGAQQLLADFMVRLPEYAERRDFPAMKGTSYLSTHLRFGTLSIRQLVFHALELGGQGASVWLSELIWREFYQMLLKHYPHVVTRCYKSVFDQLHWLDKPDRLSAWQEGRTGYPLVDAAMRQLVHSGYMHNRLRMIAASFLCKDLELDWRLGEAWFARQLLDFDLAANNGGWQWSASTGCDSQPWFRIFNPVTQSEKFDASGKFILRYVTELKGVPIKHIHAPWKMSAAEQEACGVVIGRDYPPPIVDHALARERTLVRYKTAKVKSDHVMDQD